MNFKKENCLIAFYSRKADSYVSGQIMNLQVGNTEIAAEIIRDKTDDRFFRIEMVNPYSKGYTKTTEVAKKELRENARPELTGTVAGMESYEVVFLGYPNWWGTMPMPVFTFLESYDFSGKIDITSCTHEGSGLGCSEHDISSLCSDARLVKGPAIHGSRVREAEKEISDWLERVEISADSQSPV